MKNHRIYFSRPYLGSLEASTDLHAGGIFFCIVYRPALTFFRRNNTVIMSHEIVATPSPMDNSDVDRIKNVRVKGVWSFNERNHLVCSFENRLYMQGEPTNRSGKMLAFYTSFKNERSGSAVFVLKKRLFA